MNKRISVVAIALTILLTSIVVACTPSITPASPSAEQGVSIPSSPQPTLSGEKSAPLPASVEQKIKAFLSQQAEIPESAISLKQSEAVQWSNGCLDLQNPDEICTMQVIPGYRAVFSTPQGEFTVHSDQAGGTMRLKPSSN